MPELIFIAIIALVVLGPQRLPSVMREIAKFIAQIRKLTNELTSQFSEEIAMIEELDPRKFIDEATQTFTDATKPANNKKSTKATKHKVTTSSNSIASKTTSSKSTSSKPTNVKTIPPKNIADKASETTSDESSKINDAGSTVTATSADSKIAVDKELDNSKPKAKTQTDPANAASTDPYTNRTPNRNLIKRAKKNEESDLEPDLAEAEENQIAPPQMQASIAKEAASSSARTVGNTAEDLIIDRQARSNGDGTVSDNSASDSSTSDSLTSDESI